MINFLLFFAAAPSPIDYRYADPVSPVPPDCRSVILADLASQTSPEDQRLYHSPQPITNGHELTHAVNGRLSNKGFQSLYFLNKQYVSLAIPQKIKLEDVAKYVPQSLRLHRFDTYVVKQSKSRVELVDGQMKWISHHNDNPLYLLNEQTSYNNGAEVGLELAGLGVSSEFKNDLLMAPLEMAVYATALACCIKEKDPEFWKNNKLLQKAIAREVNRGVSLYHKGKKIDHFKWENEIEENLKKDDAKHLLKMMQAFRKQ
jgi:hypothetical protein